VQAQACAWLGHWYREIAQHYFKARNCYRRSLALDPGDTVVGALSPSLPAPVHPSLRRAPRTSGSNGPLHACANLHSP
jgi:hypothetical protein